MRILVLEGSAEHGAHLVEGLPGAGNRKDLQATRLLLAEPRSHFEVIQFDEESPGDLVSARREVGSPVVHRAWRPRALKAVRQTGPWIRLHVRGRNADLVEGDRIPGRGRP